jgi:phosphatidylglycerol:prolipoprotein diacylglycerol transferase
MAMIIFAILWSLRKKPRPAGALFALYLSLAGLERFIVEIFRAKDDRFVGPLTVAQMLSLALMVGGLILFLRLRRPDGGTQVATTGAS